MADHDAMSALTRDYLPGAILFEENDPGSRMFVIRKGRVRIFRRVAKSEIVLAFLGTGDFFGEMALLEDLPRSATAEVVEPSRLVEVDADIFEEMIRGNSEIAIRIMRKLAARLRDSDRRIQTLLVDSAIGRAVEVLRWLCEQGEADGAYVRLSGLAADIDIASQAGVPTAQASSVVNELIRSGCIKHEGKDLLIASHQTLDEFAAYLDLKRKYEHHHADQLPTEAAGQKQEERLKAMQRLLSALSLTPDDFEAKQKALSSQYRRYTELKGRFLSIEKPV